MNCEKCASTGGESYIVHYGKEVSRRQIGGFGSRQFEVTYQVGGAASVELCHRCVRRRRLLWVLGAIAAALVGGALAAMLNGSTGPLGLVGAAGYAGLLAGVPVALYVAFEGRQSFGEHWAIRRRRDSLRAQGWTAVWDSKQYARLRNKQTLVGG